MSEQPLSNMLFEAALDYAQRGWRVIPLQNLTPAGACTCQAWRTAKQMGPCPTPGKHPRFAGLHDILTCDWLQRQGIGVTVPIVGMAVEAVSFVCPLPRCTGRPVLVLLVLSS